ncbi:MAG: hypothetical protein EXR62_15990 [Chloroflexi bacterium]|nr:hypothetical protein [Chloroflexota bacterium]
MSRFPQTSEGDAPIRWVLIIVGVLLILMGALWTLQGVGILLGSVMTGQPFWATVGILCLIVGAVLIYFGLRRGAVRPGM